jgi:sugar phosphate isomerase/epimerase
MSTKITLGCGEWGFRNRPLAEYFALATSLGFRHLEFGIGGGWPGRLPEAPTPADIDAFLALAQQHQVTTHYCCLENDFTKPDPAAHEAQLRKVLSQIKVASQLGAKIIRLFAGFTPVEEMTEPLWKQLTSALSQCIALAESHQMAIAIETHGAIVSQPDGSVIHRHTVTTDRAALARLITELPTLKFNFDPGNLKAANPADRIYASDILAGRINYCHMKDWKRQGTGWVACAPGDDDLDYQPLLPIAGFEGAYLIEYEPLEDTVDGFQRSLSYLRRILPGATLD